MEKGSRRNVRLWKGGGLQKQAAAALCSLLTVSLTVGVRLRQRLAGHQVHHCGPPRRKLQSSQRDVAMQEPALVDESQDDGAAHLLVLPVHWPVLVNVFGDVSRGVAGGEGELLRLPAHQDQPQVQRVWVVV